MLAYLFNIAETLYYLVTDGVAALSVDIAPLMHAGARIYTCVPSIAQPCLAPVLFTQQIIPDMCVVK